MTRHFLFKGTNMNEKNQKLDSLFNEISHQDFFQNYWRKKPLFIKGGAVDFLNCTLSDEEFDSTRQTIQCLNSNTIIKEIDNECCFIEKISSHLPMLRNAADHISSILGLMPSWIDGIRTYKKSGIGSHFDHSDNFVLQQTGVKHWQLSPPKHIPHSDIVMRMLNAPNVGSATICKHDCFDYTLEPGDLLYIPIFWIHSGVSVNQSLSLSFVAPAISIQSIVLNSLAKIIRSKQKGYSPVMSMHNYITEKELKHSKEIILMETKEIISSILDESTQADIVTDVINRITKD